MKILITTDDGEVLTTYKVVDHLPDDVDDVDITDADDVIVIDEFSNHDPFQNPIEHTVYSYYKAGRR